jgi:hypothetical protein
MAQRAAPMQPFPHAAKPPPSPASTMAGVPEDDAARLIAAGRTPELLDKIYAQFANKRVRARAGVVAAAAVVGCMRARARARRAAAVPRSTETSDRRLIPTPLQDASDLVVVGSPPMVGEQLDAEMAAAMRCGLWPGPAPWAIQLAARPSAAACQPSAQLSHLPPPRSAPVVLAIDGSDMSSPAEIFRQASLRTQIFKDHKVPVLGTIVNKVPQRDHAIIATQLRRRFEEGKVPLLGVMPEVRAWRGEGRAGGAAARAAGEVRPRLQDPAAPCATPASPHAPHPSRSQASILRAVRLDEVKEALGAEVLFSRWAGPRPRGDAARRWPQQLPGPPLCAAPPLLPPTPPKPPLLPYSTGTLDEEYSYILPGAQRLAQILDVSGHRALLLTAGTG